jgi:hypothetical protein
VPYERHRQGSELAEDSRSGTRAHIDPGEHRTPATLGVATVRAFLRGFRNDR